MSACAGGALDVPALNPQVSLTAAAVSVERWRDWPSCKGGTSGLAAASEAGRKKVSWPAIFKRQMLPGPIEPTQYNVVLLFNALQESGALKANLTDGTTRHGVISWIIWGLRHGTRSPLRVSFDFQFAGINFLRNMKSMTARNASSLRH